jgi:beta-ketodecanoyl-[acyl-carrier-protein] synthase
MGPAACERPAVAVPGIGQAAAAPIAKRAKARQFATPSNAAWRSRDSEALMTRAVITGTGLYTPPHSITNDELVASFNAYVAAHNRRNAEAIARGELAALEESSSAFVVKASGIERRYVVDREGILDPERMCPRIPERPDDALSVQAEMGVAAARQALERGGLAASEVDAVFVACSNMQRAYPAMAIEIQDALGCQGYGYDLNVACSSATFGILAATGALAAGSARAALVVSPEICTGHLNFRDRDSHFIFGDACTAVLVEAAGRRPQARGFEILGTKAVTRFSSNIRNNAGFLNRCDEAGLGRADKLFFQNGRQVFKDVCPMVADVIAQHLRELGCEPEQVKRFWLHQANLAMNEFITRKVLGREASREQTPVILDEYANTSSAGSIIAFHNHSGDFQPGELGVICSFGAGYSIGSVVVRRI